MQCILIKPVQWSERQRTEQQPGSCLLKHFLLLPHQGRLICHIFTENFSLLFTFCHKHTVFQSSFYQQKLVVLDEEVPFWFFLSNKTLTHSTACKTEQPFVCVCCLTLPWQTKAVLYFPHVASQPDLNKNHVLMFDIPCLNGCRERGCLGGIWQAWKRPW